MRCIVYRERERERELTMKSISTDNNYGQAGSNNHFKRLLRCMLSRGEEDGEDDARELQ